jgi:hypothetical protein
MRTFGFGFLSNVRTVETLGKLGNRQDAFCIIRWT